MFIQSRIIAFTFGRIYPMNDRPPITLTSCDYERLTQMLMLNKYRTLPGIDELQDELDRANVVEPEELPNDVITINSTARFIDETSNEQFEITLVYPDKADGATKISVLAPVGSALLGMSVGQSIPWQVPGRQKLLLKVLDVKKPDNE